MESPSEPNNLIDRIDSTVTGNIPRYRDDRDTYAVLVAVPLPSLEHPDRVATRGVPSLPGSPVR